MKKSRDMQALADKEGAKIKIEPWDYRYYAEKVRKAKLRSRSERGEAVPAAREIARGHVLGCRRALQLQLHAGRQMCPWPIPTFAFGK